MHSLRKFISRYRAQLLFPIVNTVTKPHSHSLALPTAASETYVH